MCASCFPILPLPTRYYCVAVCCSVLQCVAVCCGVLQCVAVCWGESPVKHERAPHISTTHYAHKPQTNIENKKRTKERNSRTQETCRKCGRVMTHIHAKNCFRDSSTHVVERNADRRDTMAGARGAGFVVSCAEWDKLNISQIQYLDFSNLQIHLYICTYTYAGVNICLHDCTIYMCVYIHLHVSYTYIYIYIYIHIHIHVPHQN